MFDAFLFRFSKVFFTLFIYFVISTPNMGLKASTLGSRVACPSDGASQVPLVFHFYPAQSAVTLSGLSDRACLHQSHYVPGTEPGTAGSNGQECGS